MNIKLNSLDEAQEELIKLADKQLVNDLDWSPYQSFVHCAKTVDYSMSGYPSIKPAIIRNTVGKLVIRKFLKQGYMKHNLMADVPGSPAIDDSASSQDGIQVLIQSIEKYKAYKEDLKPHLLFGKLSKEQYDKYFALHIADHLSSISIEMVELRGKEKAYPAQLSGGQQQRVALARSIVTRPKVLLLDEPLSAIDAKLRRSLQTRIREIQKSLGITAVFVTHDQDEAMIMSDVIHLLSAGKIEQSGSPIEMYTAPKTRFAASFIGHYNILEPASFTALTGHNAPVSGDIAIRPEAVEISTVPQEFSDCAYHLCATIDSYIPHGNVLRYTVTSSGVSLEADVLFRSFTIFEPGQTVYLCIQKRNCLPV